MPAAEADADARATADALLARLRDIVGASHVITDAADQAPFLTDWRRRYTGRALAVVRPGSTQEVAAVVRACADTRTAVVPQGGNTGLVGGATPDASGRAIVLSLRRMNAIREVDAANATLVAEAGCTLAEAQAAAESAGLMLALTLASQGSCTVGGNLSTNAGGVQVLRYGNAREQCLGLEVVTASGDVWNGLSGLRKDNTGYDLRDLFIGAEGTLGVITAACLRLHPKPRARVICLFALDDLHAATRLLMRAQAMAGPALTAFEVFNALCLDLVLKHVDGARAPFAERAPQYALLELSDHESEVHGIALAEAIAAAAIDAGEARDAVIAQNGAQAKALWALRENLSEAQAREGKNLKLDISVPVSRVAAFVDAAREALGSEQPGIRLVTFGHLGDGNLHFNLSPPLDTDGRPEPEASFLARQNAVYRLVHDLVLEHAGSISAEHGIGQLRRDELLRTKPEPALALMRAIKQALDPDDLMNPGKLIPRRPS
ncbi:FAD-binding oxidoreductase [Derxia gummosa]|uniref:FAD-binding oxidoreductase n=1 Tax=Derxia gummosa DSM 723 TaxID=1121388 RepID=A0A8B6XAB3_9BURK|nr:FAD-binding oxidoreductase [Derxia gummosa]